MKLIHIGLQYFNETEADIFFCEILGLKKKEEFLLDSQVSKIIFGINKEIKVKIFSNESIEFEIFFTGIKSKLTFEHICLSVESRDKIIRRCNKHNIYYINFVRNNRTYLFIRDPQGYLYEIKELRQDQIVIGKIS